MTISDFSRVLRTYEAEIILMHLNNHLRSNWPWPELILKELLRHLKKPDLSMVKNLRNDLIRLEESLSEPACSIGSKQRP